MEISELQKEYNTNQKRMLMEKLSDEMFEALEDYNADLMVIISQSRRSK